MLSYTEKGQGQALVLLHGFCEDRSLWGFYQQELSAGFRLICPDLPGFGASSPLPQGALLADYAHKVAELIDHLGESKIILVGHSMGGYISLAFAELFPERLAGLGLFHSSVFADSDEKREGRAKTIEFIEKNGLEVFIDLFAPGLFYDKKHPAIPKIAAMGHACPPEGVTRAMWAMGARKGQEETLKNLACPVMYIVGKEDQSVPLAASLEQIALAKQTRALILEKVAHAGMFEATDDCFRFLRDFAQICAQES